VGHDFAEVEAVLLSDTLEEGVALLAEVVMRPAFPEAETERVRAESLDAIEARERRAGQRGRRPRLAGGVRRLPSVRPAAVRHGGGGRRRAARGAARLPRGALPAGRRLPGGGGRLRPRRPPRRAARRRLPRLERHGAAGRLPRAGGGAGGRRTDRACRGRTRAVGDPRRGVGLDRRSPDWVAGAVANYVLGGSTITGRLGANLREDKGWTYGVRSAFSAGLGRGGWIAETAVDVEVTADAVAEMVGELTRMVREPVGADELRRAKDALILSLPRVFETPAHVAGRFATLEAYDLPRDYWERYPAAVEAVTAEDVQRIARERWDPERLVRIVVGGLDGEDAPAGQRPAP
jgi:zinc protease